MEHGTRIRTNPIGRFVQTPLTERTVFSLKNLFLSVDNQEVRFPNGFFGKCCRRDQKAVSLSRTDAFPSWLETQPFESTRLRMRTISLCNTGTSSVFNGSGPRLRSQR